LGAVLLLYLLVGPRHRFALLSAPEIAIVIASTALSVLVTIVVGQLRSGRVALVRALPDIERRARDRAHDAASRKIEEERRHTANARTEVAELQRALQQRNAAASTASAARAEYLRQARLAIRLPLGTVARYATRLRSLGQGAQSPAEDLDIDGIELCEEHLATLVETILAPSRVESGQLVPEIADVSLLQVMKQALALAEPILAARGITVEHAQLEVARVRADAAVLTQVLARLLLDGTSRDRACALRLAAAESGDAVVVECERVNDETPTTATSEPGAVAVGRNDIDESDWSALAAAEQVARMGGALTMGAAPGVVFTIRLSTRSANGTANASAPVTVWPPIAFELPRASGIGSPSVRR
jgi:K+-sensing histidine kinase KdpD